MSTGLGEFLIKQAVQQLQHEFPSSLETFVTLSPMPAFRKWVENTLSLQDSLSDQEWAQDLATRGIISSSLIPQFADIRPFLRDLVLRENIEDGKIDGHLEVVKESLMALAAYYLAIAKNSKSGKPADPVTGFHVGNGAEVYRINYAADLSRKGLLRSFGVMVNYRYELENIESNKAMFESSHFSQIPVSTMVQDLLAAPDN